MNMITKLTFLLTLVAGILSSKVLAQQVVMADLVHPDGIDADSSTMYVADFHFRAGDSSIIYQLEKQHDTFLISRLCPNLSMERKSIAHLQLHDGYLYICFYSPGVVSRLNLADSNCTLEEVAVGLDGPSHLAFFGDHMYISESGVVSPSGQISSLDLTKPNKTVTPLIEGLTFPDGLLMIGNWLYYTERGSINKISKVDLTQSPLKSVDVVDGLDNPLDLLKVQESLLILEFDGDRVSYINLWETDPNLKTLIKSIDGPSRATFFGDSLCVQELEKGQVLCYNFPDLKLNMENQLKAEISIWPNPTSGRVKVELDRNDQYHISVLDCAGKLIQFSEFYGKQAEIEFQEGPGIYLLKIESPQNTVVQRVIRK